MVFLNKPHGRVMHETYRVKDVEQIKCRTILRLEGAFSIHLRRLYTNQSLVEKVIGDEIDVSRIEHPPLPNSFILDVLYNRQQIYPILLNKENQRGVN
jgi:hypothetical protein